MNDSQVITEFRRLIADFKKKETFVLACLRKGNLKEDPIDSIIEDIYKVGTEIKEKLSQYDVLQIDDLPLRNDLIEIRERNFVPDIPEDRWWEILQEEIIGSIDPDTLIRRKMDLGALLVGKKVPEHLRHHLGMIKKCYEWNFGNAASIYCRTILEEGFREALKSKPESGTPQGKKGLEQMDLSWLIEHSKQKRYFNKEVIDKASLIRMNVNKIVHPSKKEPKITLTNIEIIKDTFYILEMLFR
jgi:hypothetical protein